MTYIANKDYFIEVAKGNVPGSTLVDKFGSNASIGTTITPVTSSGLYQTPTAAANLEFLSTSSSDGAAGLGARKVTVEGLDASGDFQTEDIITNGTTAVPLSNAYLRVFRMYVKESGTYATATASSHAGTLVVRGAGGGAVWASISVVGGFGLSQSQIGVYTVPNGFTAYLLSYSYSIDSNKSVDLFIFKRENILDITTPFEPMRLQGLQDGVTGAFQFEQQAHQVYEQNTDFGFMARVTNGTASVSVDFQLLLVEN